MATGKNCWKWNLEYIDFFTDFVTDFFFEIYWFFPRNQTPPHVSRWRLHLTSRPCVIFALVACLYLSNGESKKKERGPRIHYPTERAYKSSTITLVRSWVLVLALVLPLETTARTFPSLVVFPIIGLQFSQNNGVVWGTEPKTSQSQN